MKTDSAIMTEIAQRSSMLRRLSEFESQILKENLLEMFLDIDSMCRSHNLDLLLVGGSALGAARHKGFIPWDDDLDVALNRSDYDTLIRLLKNGALDNKYSFTCPSPDADSKNLFLKIYKNGSINAEITDLYTPFPKGIYIDIFPIENAVVPGWRNKIKSFFTHILSFISVSALYHQYKSKEYKDFMYLSKDGKSRYKLRMITGALASVLSHKKWVNIFEQFAKKNNDTGYVTIPTGRKGYSGETLPKDVMFPVGNALFEGHNVKVPRKLHEYLSNLYGNYMEIPPIEKRERHYVVDFKCEFKK